MRLFRLLTDPKALQAALSRRLLALAERVLSLGHKRNASGNNMSQR
jgi:hypothetical protein